MSDYRGVPGAFLHEMMHWLALTPHSTSTYPLYHLVRTEHTDHHYRVVDDIAYTFPNSPGPVNCYGLIECFRLAQADQPKAKTNADNYRIFAEHAYMPAIDFIDENRPPNVPAPPPIPAARMQDLSSSFEIVDKPVPARPVLHASATTQGALGISGLPDTLPDILPAPSQDNFEPANDAVGKTELAQNKASFTSAMEKAKQTSSSSSSTSKKAMATGFVTQMRKSGNVPEDL